MDARSLPPRTSDAPLRISPQLDSIWRYYRWIAVLLPAALWIWLCWDWPSRLGFYSDDWMVLLHPFVGTAEAFRDTINIVATRPVSAPYIWLAQVIVDWSPVRSQILNAAMLLVTAASVGMLAGALSSVVHGFRAGALIAACVGAATFVVFPSNVGTFAWGTGVTTAIPAVPLFCLATSLLLHSEGNWPRLILGLTLALLSHLSYEAFYFQEINFVLLAAVLRGEKIKDLHWRAIIGAALVNVACLASNRLNPGGIQKSFHWDFLSIFLGGYSQILSILGHAVREHRLLIAGTMLIAGPSGAVCLARIVGGVRVYLLLLLTVCGVVAAGFLYASAGYGFSAEGIAARVGIVLATYYSVAAGVLAATVWFAIGRHRLPAIVFSLATAVSLVTLELTARARVNEWADTWSYEMARLSRLPVAMASFGGYQRVYVAIEDKGASAIEPATAPWEITGAVAWATYKATNNRSLTLDLWHESQTLPRWIEAAHDRFNRWDGHRFEQGFCGSSAVIYSAEGSEFWAWDTSSGELGAITAPWKHGCQQPRSEVLNNRNTAASAAIHP
jgi:hypothetical protein